MLKRENLKQALALLSKQATVLVPANTEGASRFMPFKEDLDLDGMGLINTVLPPKDYLFSQTEKLYSFKKDGQRVTVEEAMQADPRIVFGIRPCDVASIGCLDKVFLTGDFVDSVYKAKREKFGIIAIGCDKADKTCFCSSMGVEPGEAALADILLYPTADSWNLAIQSEMGKAMAETMKDALIDGEEEKLPGAVPELKIDMDGVPEKLSSMFDHPMWDEAWRSCLGCGTCTFVCPTCYCFEMETLTKGNEGITQRTWDSCMFSEYTRMAGGHNPRPSKKERVRNRFMHKLSFFKERYGQNLCVGCGRCLSKCPKSMDIIHIAETAKELK
ncbi:MAG: 4Fe-4S dicluster domain-containing protein [Treponema sp.]|nr:4Fe-4S dicluster domain-containing protein [Treponema sp.]